ncbi:MAG: hypothetical protein QGI68_18650 [Pseudomonadales bacterium]|jgi:hypothetical protein|nr:hypothetical protein [Pseudomonadales bacterium]MDP7360322.1 hypothetical protein [Pseudomonadales bacterium]MDP7597566.1 hypothetical protein [Pseudomonadales bacterium]HJN50780.1 hypothetical protein [Pseudomonadales bacterium]
MLVIEELMEEIDAALRSERYRPGAWQRLVTEVRKLPVIERLELEERISALGNRLHQRHGFPQMGFPLAFAVEIGMCVCGLAVLLGGTDSLIVAIAGLGLLLLSMQPLVKVVVGLLIGVRYAYAYLWYIEPRFKMQYGSYLTVASFGRVLLHLAGSLGTPMALLLGFVCLRDDFAELSLICWELFWLMLLVQIIAFVAEWVGFTKVGSFRLSLLTSPATAAMELKLLLTGPQE